MRKKLLFSLTIVLLISTLGFAFPQPAGAWLQSYEVSAIHHYGFFRGLLHGIIAPVAVFAQLFDKQIVLYSSINNGFSYNLGFLLGLSMVIGGGASKRGRGCHCD